jgi:hypothetical protein
MPQQSSVWPWVQTSADTEDPCAGADQLFLALPLILYMLGARFLVCENYSLFCEMTDSCPAFFACDLGIVHTVLEKCASLPWYYCKFFLSWHAVIRM